MSIPSPFPAHLDLKKPVCVFCGSSPGKLTLYTAASDAVGQALAKAGIPLVYGGGRRGIMGVVSQACLKAGGLVHGIVPQALTERAAEHTPAPGASTSKEGQGEEVLNDDYDGRLTTDVVGSMHERKHNMAKISQGGFIVLPGGYGTFEEALEMITWNQLGIHRLPIIILNVGNFYTHLYDQFVSSVDAGFIAPANLSLLKLVNLEGGSTANADESKANEWGDAAIRALNDWDLAEGTGYGLDWEVKPDRAGGETSQDSGSSKPLAIAEQTDGPRWTRKLPDAIFTTLRYTSPSPNATVPVQRSSLPLLDLHLQRLDEAFSHFSQKDEDAAWGMWPGQETVWAELKQVLEDAERRERGDWRVRVIVHPDGKVEVQCVPAPKDAGPFLLHPSASRSVSRRPIVIDPDVTEPTSESSEQVDLRLYKTVNRDMYDDAYSRGGALVSPDIHPEVLLHTRTQILETTTSNIAVQLPNSERWVTPKLGKDHPFLNGVMRRYLLAKGIIEQGEVTLDMIEEVKEGGRIIGFNGLRGVWEGEII
ncbi:uncharacterized protein IL334_004205 [Kwoniella shivajii]|uniref:TIGR00730 family protein n=1 Tax=Kwoniella shivajii TaxID=564305 RepID=A0ABZ1CZP4_9TREE|nr:hypothetical protein IL334_004205 [Kwoniella shivajii]